MEIIQITTTNEKEIIARAANLLIEGHVIIFPTDTIYGLCANASNTRAVNCLFKIKKRDIIKPCPVLVPSTHAATHYARVPRVIAKQYWPGPYTLILDYKKGLAKGAYNTKNNSVALRVPNAPFIIGLLKKVKVPLVATSANIAGEQYQNDPDIIARVFSHTPSPHTFFNKGKLTKTTPSTIIDAHTGELHTVRK
jgi:L-threonylcarbamoyladenylate synthase